MADFELSLRLSADGQTFVGTMRAARSEVDRVGGAMDKTGREAKDLARETSQTERSMQQLGRASNALRTALAGIGIGLSVAGIVSFGRSVVQSGLEVEKFRTGLTAATGSSQTATAELAFLRGEAERLGLRFNTLAGSYTQLAAAAKGTALEGKAVREIFSAVAEASRVMGLSSAEAEGALRAISQMMSKGTVQAEELRGQLGERIPGAFQIAARAMGVTTAKLGDMLQAGEVLADDLLPRFAKELRNAVSGGLDSATQGPAAEFERLANSFDDLKIAIADSGLLSALASLADGLSDVAKGARKVLENVGLVKSRLESVQLSQTTKDLSGAREELARLQEQRATLARLAEQPTTFGRNVGPQALAEADARIAQKRAEIQRLERDLARLRTSDIDRAEFTGELGFTPDRGPRNFAAEERALMEDLDLDFRLNSAEERRREAAQAVGAREAESRRRERERESREEMTRHRQEVEAEARELERSRRERERVAESQQEIIDNLEEEILLFGKSRGEVEAYRLGLRGGTPEQQALARSLGDTVDQLHEQRDAMEESARASERFGRTLQDAFEAAIVRGDSLRDVLSNLAAQLSSMLLDSAAQGLRGGSGSSGGGLLGAVFSGIGGLFGGGGGGGFLGGSAGASILDPVGGFSLSFHDGGVVGAGGGRGRFVPAMAFAGAPRMHSGGIAGDEVPAILKRGEEVLTRNDPRHAANGGGGGVSVSQNITIDARGADQGVEQRLRVALERNKRETIAQVRSEIVRGGPMRGLVRG